ncbi:MAG: serine/threonine dehydratase [Nocardioidaceae bacterium]|nr:serine/threonine dehydratase [Nocardioidaceae bacterium]
MRAPRPRRADIEAAAFRLGGAIRRTPVITLAPEETGLDAHVALKLELLQHSGSFKARGALNSVLTLAPGTGAVCAASGGNHGGAVAWAAQRSGVVADVFVPVNAPEAKVERIRDYGARVHLVEGTVKEALMACQDFSDAEGAPLIHPYDAFETVAGAGTLGLEIEEQVPEAGLVVVACGGGGLYAGLAASLEGVARVQPVEPDRCPSLAAALAAGERVEVAVGGVAVDSLGAASVGEIAFESAQESAVDPVVVTDAQITAARHFLWQRVRVLAEPGACVALASVLGGQTTVPAGQTAVVVISGGNNTTLPTLVEGVLVGA